MRLDKSILKEEAYTGEDLIADSKISALDRKCFVIRQVVADNDLTFEEALAAYGVSAEEYINYLSRFMVAEFTPMIAHASPITAMTASIVVIGEMYKILVSKIDDDAQVVQDHLQALVGKISSGKVALKGDYR